MSVILQKTTQLLCDNKAKHESHDHTPTVVPPAGTNLVGLVHLEGDLTEAVADLAEESQHAGAAQGRGTGGLGQFVVQLEELYEGGVDTEQGLLGRPVQVPQINKQPITLKLNTQGMI